MGRPGLLILFIFVLFKHKFNRQNYRLGRDSNLDRRKEGKDADHLTTVTAQVSCPVDEYNKIFALAVCGSVQKI